MADLERELRLARAELLEMHMRIARERSEERSQALKDARKFLAGGLRDIGIPASDDISLVEVLTIIRGLADLVNRIADYLPAEFAYPDSPDL